MSLFILGYLLPLVISIGCIYFIMKKEGETVGDFLNMVMMSFVPLLNIVLIILVILMMIDEHIKIDEKWEKFKKRKL